MERTAWTDERLDELARRMDAGFERLDRDVRDLRVDVGGLRVEMGQRFDALQTTLMRIGGAMIVGLFGTIVGLVGTIVAVSLGGP